MAYKYLHVVLCLLAHVSTSVPVESYPRCSRRWKQRSGSPYCSLSYRVELSWIKAGDICHQYGAELVAILSTPEHNPLAGDKFSEKEKCLAMNPDEVSEWQSESCYLRYEATCRKESDYVKLSTVPPSQTPATGVLSPVSTSTTAVTPPTTTTLPTTATSPTTHTTTPKSNSTFSPASSGSVTTAATKPASTGDAGKERQTFSYTRFIVMTVAFAVFLLGIVGFGVLLWLCQGQSSSLCDGSSGFTCGDGRGPGVIPSQRLDNSSEIRTFLACLHFAEERSLQKSTKETKT